MKATYCQRGGTLDYIPTEDVESGAVVSLGTRVGVAAAPIPAGGQGAVHVAGVFAMPKAGGEAIPQGAAVYYDAAADAITASATADAAGAAEGAEDESAYPTSPVPAGYAAASAAAADAAVLVKLLG